MNIGKIRNRQSITTGGILLPFNLGYCIIKENIYSTEGGNGNGKSTKQVSNVWRN